MLDRQYFYGISELSPFEIKDELIKLARAGAEETRQRLSHTRVADSGAIS